MVVTPFTCERVALHPRERASSATGEPLAVDSMPGFLRTFSYLSSVPALYS